MGSGGGAPPPGVRGFPLDGPETSPSRKAALPGCDRSYRNRRSQLSVMCSLQNPTVHAVHTQPMQILPGSLCQTPRREPTASLSANSVDLELSVAQSLGTRLHRSAGCQLRTARRWVLGGRPVGQGVVTEEEMLAGAAAPS